MGEGGSKNAQYAVHGDVEVRVDRKKRKAKSGMEKVGVRKKKIQKKHSDF